MNARKGHAGFFAIPIEDRLAAYTKIEGRCWVWTGRVGHNGYGRMRVNRRDIAAHRVAYEHYVGPIPAGFQLDHLCRVRTCVNPAHLEPVTPRENTMRSSSVSAANARKTHCKRGHPLSGANLGKTSTGGRKCKRCQADHTAQYKRRRATA